MQMVRVNEKATQYPYARSSYIRGSPSEVLVRLTCVCLSALNPTILLHGPSVQATST